MTALTTPDQIKYAQLCARIGALKLECAGMRRRGQSALAICRKEYNLRGSRASVLERLERLRDRMLLEAQNG